MKKYFYILFYTDIDKTFISSYAYGEQYNARFNRDRNTNKIHQWFLSHDGYFFL